MQSRNHNFLPNNAAHLSSKFQSVDAKKCAVCKQTLTVHQQAIGETCGELECKSQFLRNRLQTERKLKAELQSKATALREAVAGSIQSNGLPIAIVPANEQQLSCLPQKRVRMFRGRLMQIISQAAAIRFGGQPQQPSGDHQPTDDGVPTVETLNKNSLAILGNACATCQGNCCRQGGDHAFLRVETILGFMERHAGLRPRDVLHAYLSKLGHKTYEQSCVYHAEGGCSLPREMRSRVCNEYLCEGLHGILEGLKESPGGRFFVVATVGQEISRAAIIDSTRQILATPSDRSGEEDRSGNTISGSSTESSRADCDSPRKE